MSKNERAARTRSLTKKITFTELTLEADKNALQGLKIQLKQKEALIAAVENQLKAYKNKLRQLNTRASAR